jgi:hypothetical protein
LNQRTSLVMSRRLRKSRRKSSRIMCTQLQVRGSQRRTRYTQPHPRRSPRHRSGGRVTLLLKRAWLRLPKQRQSPASGLGQRQPPIPSLPRRPSRCLEVGTVSVEAPDGPGRGRQRLPALNSSRHPQLIVCCLSSSDRDGRILYMMLYVD